MMNPQIIKIQDIDGFWHTDFYYQPPISSDIKHHVETTHLRATKGYKKKAIRKAKAIQERVLKSLQAKAKNYSQTETSELNSESIESRDVINLETKLKLITKRNGYWHMDFSYVHPETKKQKRYRGSTKLASLSQNKSKALRMALEMRNALSHSEITNKTENNVPKEPLFSDIAKEYMEMMQLSPSSRKSYNSILRIHLLPRFGNIPLTNITTRMIDHWFGTFRGVEKDLSMKTKKNIRAFLSQIFAKAVAWKYCSENPVLGAEKVRLEEKEMLFWRTEERDAFLESVAKTDPNYFAAFATFLFTGMRVGEILALHWKNIDLNRSVIHVRLNYVEGIEKLPKSKKTRSIQICDFLLEVLKQHKEKNNVHSLVFPNKNGSHRTNSMFRRPFLRNIELAGVQKIRLHDMRHTFASLSLMQGVDLVTIQKWLGHKDITTTMKYVKVLEEHLYQESKKLGGGLNLSSFFMN